VDNGGPHSGANAGQLSISTSQKPVLWKRSQDRVDEAACLGVGVPFWALAREDRSKRRRESEAVDTGPISAEESLSELVAGSQPV
jgi:hypothetical protein